MTTAIDRSMNNTHASYTSGSPVVIKHGSASEGKGGRHAKVIVIGVGRFGNALVQGIRQSFVHYETGSGTIMVPTEVFQVSARRFLNLSVAEMANTFQDCKYIVYSGTHLTKNATKVAAAMKVAKSISAGSFVAEFMDFSNPDPLMEKNDVPGAIKLWSELTYGQDKNHGWKIWKITECGLLDVAGIEEPNHDYAKVYGAGIQKYEVPELTIAGLRWQPAQFNRHDLFAEAYDRMMERADMDRWWDAFFLGLATFVATAGYCITRDLEIFNGKYPFSMLPLYVFDKAFAWTGLWMLIISPFAGNLLALHGVMKSCGNLGFMDYLVFIVGAVLMIFPTFEFLIPFVLWFIFRNIFFVWSGGRGISLYEHQHAGPVKGAKKHSVIRAMLIDMVSLKGETGCVGFAYALIHTFMGFIIADPAYKKKWFDKEKGRLFWNHEACLASGCIATGILFFVTLRSLFGKASWIRLKPLYAYASPIGMWFATAHVVFFGFTGWHKVFKFSSRNGQPSISFMSSMFAIGVLLVNWIMACSGTKTRLVSGGMHLWKHSVVRIAKEQFINLKQKYAGAETTAVIKMANFVPYSQPAPVAHIHEAPQMQVSQLGSTRFNNARRMDSSGAYTLVSSSVTDDEMSV